MALALDSSCLHASAFPRTGGSASQASSFLQGSGSDIPFSNGLGTFVNAGTGVVCNVNSAHYLEVAPGDASNVGRTCSWANGGDVDTLGVVIAALQVESGTSGGTGALAQFVLVQAADYRYLAPVSAVTFKD